MHGTIRSHLESRAVEFLTEFRDAICPVYDLDARGQLDLLGTALLVRVGRGHFAVSAKHVFDHLRDQSLAIAGETIAELAAREVFFTRAVSGETDRFDLAFTQLTPNELADLGRVRFVTIDDMATSERPDFSRPGGSKYYALGFPCNAQDKPEPGFPTVPRSMIVQTLPASVAQYPRLKVSAETHILLDLDRKNVSGRTGRMTAPKLHGMSGGGVWTAPKTLERRVGEEKLVAVLTEYHAGAAKVIVGTRVGILLDGILRSVEH